MRYARMAVPCQGTGLETLAATPQPPAQMPIDSMGSEKIR